MPSETTAAVCGVLALFCLIVSVMQFMEKGPLMNNAWIWATRKEREAMDKKLHYRQSGVVFAFLSVIFYCAGVRPLDRLAFSCCRRAVRCSDNLCFCIFRKRFG